MDLLRKIRLKIYQCFSSGVNKILHFVEARPLSKSEESRIVQPIIFVIGAPRSGTTLLSQVLINKLEINFISNEMAKRYGGMSMLSKRSDYGVQNFESYHGITKGPGSPHEAGSYWYQFFPRLKVYQYDLSDFEVKQRKLIRSMHRIRMRAENPIMFKNVYNTLRIKSLASTFPDAVFIVSKRNLLDNAHSILEGRFRVNQTYEKWWGPNPGVNPKGKSPVEQVCEEIKLFDNYVNKARFDFGAEKFLNVQYEELCREPEKSADRIYNYLNQHFDCLRKKNSLSLEPFHQKRQCRIDKSLYSELKKYCANR